MPVIVLTASLNTVVTNLDLLKARVEAMGQRNVCYDLISKPQHEMMMPQKSANGAINVMDILVEARYPLNMRRCTRDLDELIIMNIGDHISSKVVSNGDRAYHHKRRVISMCVCGGGGHKAGPRPS
jgi:hypothetical protein